MTKLPGVNIQWPISESILEGKKVIETRTYPLPEKYLNQKMVMIETPGKKGNFKARGVAIIKFTKCFKYKNKAQFKKDIKKHLVEEGSIWDWKDKTKYGWEVTVLKVLRNPIAVPANRGYIFCKDISVPQN